MIATFFSNIYQLWSIAMIYGALTLRYAQLDAQERRVIAPGGTNTTLVDISHRGRT
jgi:hypothetical protein